MQLSARNQIPARVTAVNEGASIANVELDANGTRLVASITVEAARQLGLSAGSEVTAIIKASDVLIGVPRLSGIRATVAGEAGGCQHRGMSDRFGTIIRGWRDQLAEEKSAPRRLVWALPQDAGVDLAYLETVVRMADWRASGARELACAGSHPAGGA